MTDEELVREVQERLALRQSAEARQSLGCLVERQYDWLMRMCLFETSSRELAEECVQQIMLELTKSIGSFSFRSSLKTWLFAIARRTVKRHRKRHYRLLSFFEREQEEFREECARGVDAVFPDGETRRLVSERGRRVLDGVRRLAEAQRQAVFLHYYEDLSIEETARRMGCSASSVKTHLLRARKKLRSWFDEHGEGMEQLL